ncbi:MAG TPA: cation transport protein [Firmicutes bacterium]|nr:cation transport protein [Bacillota bacterium]
MNPTLSERLIHRMKETPPVRFIVISFAIIITLGTLLLWLPMSSRNFAFTHPVDAFFTAASATCVTGLVPFDTWTHWNGFGQVVIILLIQVGGLGVSSITSGFAVLMRKKMGLRELWLASESANGDSLDVRRLLGIILRFTLICEGVGAALLMIRFLPEYGAYGIWISIFTAISGFCNAGFDVFGIKYPGQNMIPYVNDPLVCLTVAALIIVGGIGFVVVNEVYYNQIRPRVLRQSRRRLSLHSMTCITFTGVLLLFGTVVLFCSEYNSTMKDMHFLTRLNASFFQSVSARTAGFASVDIAAEHDFSKIITILLMFIGACPGSTGGGIKVTTFVVLASTTFSVFRGCDGVVFRRHRIHRDIVYRAIAITLAAFALVCVVTGIILTFNEELGGIDALFEAVSAFATVGISAGVTPTLDYVSKVFLGLLMFIGRVGPVSLALAISVHCSGGGARGGDRRGGAVLPEGKLIVG